jgi:endonuclease/exonuclease/phosphatase family metal-dependent hydrolase
MIRVLSYNVFWRPNLIRFGKSEWAKERAAILLSKLDDYDVVVLSECFAFVGSPVSSFIAAMKDKGFIYWARTPPVPLLTPCVVDGGLIVFSKLPILDTEVKVFDLLYGLDTWIAKGCVYARIQTGPGTHVHLFAIHPQANYRSDLRSCSAVKFTHLRQMMAVVKRKAMDGQPIVVAGDLNVDALADAAKQGRTTSEYNRLIQTLTFGMDGYTLQDCLLETLGSHPVTFGEDEKIFTKPFDQGTKQSLDYIFVLNRDDGEYIVKDHTGGVKKFEVDGNKRFTHLSDHYGVEATLRLGRRVEENAV